MKDIIFVVGFVLPLFISIWLGVGWMVFELFKEVRRYKEWRRGL